MDAAQMSPTEYFDILKRRKWSLILPALIVIFFGIAVAFTLPSIYKSTSTILIEKQEIPSDFVMTTVTSYAEQRLQTINQRIMSFTRLMEIIQRFDLYPEYKDKWNTEDIVAKMQEDTILEPINAEVMDRRTGRPTSATIAFTLSYQGKNPNTVQRVANVLTSLFLSENLQVREKQAKDTSAFLEGEREKIGRQLSDLESRIAVFKQEHINELPEMLAANMRSLEDMKRDLVVANNRLNSLRERELHLDTYLAGIKPHIGDLDQKVTIRNRLDELKVHLVHLTKRFSDEYPDVKKTRAEITELEQQLKGEEANKVMKKGSPDNPTYISISSRLANTRAEIVLLQNEIKELDLSVAEYQRRIATTPRVEEEFNALNMERNNTQIKYNDLMAKHMEARVAQGLEREQKGERFTLIEPARLPEKPYKPNRIAIMLIGLAFGVGLGIGVAALREFSDDAVHKADQLERIANFPVLAGIPLIVTKRDLRFRQIRRVALAAGSLGVIVGALLIFHFYVMDLNVFWIKLMRRLVL